MIQIINKKLIKLTPTRVYKPFLGGKLIDAWEGRVCEDGHYGERWIASTVKATDGDGGSEGLSRIEGTKEEVFLLDHIKDQPERLLGSDHVKVYGNDPGLLVKAIDAYSRLLIQVHPDKKRAREYFDSPYGKTEAWYIIGSREINGVKPYILLGFKEGIEEGKYKEWFKNQDIDALEACMHRIEVKEGDMFFIPGGLPHALGAGCFLVEIQEPTDITIRSEIHGASGDLLPEMAVHQGLGYEDMFKCYDFVGMNEAQIRDLCFKEGSVSRLDADGQIISLIDHDYFTMKKVLVHGKMDLRRQGAFEVALVLKGRGQIRSGDEVIQVNQADECLISNEITDYTIQAAAGDPLEVLLCLPPKS